MHKNEEKLVFCSILTAVKPQFSAFFFNYSADSEKLHAVDYCIELYIYLPYIINQQKVQKKEITAQSLYYMQQTGDNKCDKLIIRLALYQSLRSAVRSFRQPRVLNLSSASSEVSGETNN